MALFAIRLLLVAGSIVSIVETQTCFEEDCQADNDKAILLQTRVQVKDTHKDLHLTTKHTILCIGASITKGAGASSLQKSYPSQLQEMLGSEFEVLNFGDPGATVRQRHGRPLDIGRVLMGSHHSYWDYPRFQEALRASGHADAIIITFGTNDSREWGYFNRTQFLEQFRSDYAALVKLFQDSRSQPKVYLMVPPPLYLEGAKPVYMDGAMHGMQQTFINEVLPIEVQRLAQTTGTNMGPNLVSMFMKYCPDLSNDICQLMSTPMHCGKTCVEHSEGCHPDDMGYHLIAEAVFHTLRVDFPHIGYKAYHNELAEISAFNHSEASVGRQPDSRGLGLERVIPAVHFLNTSAQIQSESGESSLSAKSPHSTAAPKKQLQLLKRPKEMSPMSTTYKLIFLSTYATFLIALIFVVQLVSRACAWQDKQATNSRALEAHAVSKGDAVESTHGPPAQFPCTVVTEQFLQTSSDFPKRVALRVVPHDGQTCQVTYEDLARTIQTLANKLTCLGVGKGTFVVLAVDRGLSQVAAIYATMLCEAAWVPVDPAVPEQRFREVIHDSSPALVLHQEDAKGLQLAAWANSAGVCTATATPDTPEFAKSKASLQSREVAEMGDCALVIYTSGTTGKPKGIMYSHAMLNHGTHAIADLMEINRDSVAFLKTPYIWAVVEWELFPALVRGGTLVVGSAKAHTDPQYMARTILAERISSLVMAPDVLDLLLDVHEQGSHLQSLTHVVTVGAGLPVALANRFAQMHSLSAKLHNVYGASESSCAVWTVPASGVDGRLWSNRAPVGTPQTGCSIWILDEELRRVPCGDVGEICFGGQLALGYFKLPELTEQKFVIHPDLGRIYRTGDLGLWRAGVLEICGRKDRQVKIRGVRVEPEEVESALKTLRLPLSFPSPGTADEEIAMKSVACVATTGSSPELVAFVTPVLDKTQIESVRQLLARTLPHFYVPKYIFSKAELPLLPNGKVNLRALVEEAGKLVESSDDGEVMMDSLGRMRNMSKAAILENQVIHRCYAYWMLGVLCDHWFQCTGVFEGYCHVPQMPGVVPAWVELFIRQVGNDQDMFGFIFLGGLQDSRLQPGERKPRLRLGYADALCSVIYLLMGFPLPQLLYHIFGPDYINPYCKLNWPLDASSGHRWYLYMIVLVHLCIVLWQKLGVPAWLQTLIPAVLYLFGPQVWFDPCRRNIPDWLKWFCCLVFPYNHQKVTPLGEVETFCPVMTSSFQLYMFYYVVAYYCSRPGMKMVTGFITRQGCNTAVWAAAACGVSLMIGAAQAAFHYPNQMTLHVETSTQMNWWFLPLEFGANMLQSLLFVLAMAWFPFDLSWWGNTTLGTYIFHYYFTFAATHAQDVLRWLKFVKGLPQLMFLLACPAFFMTVVGPFCHYLILLPITSLHRVRSK